MHSTKHKLKFPFEKIKMPQNLLTQKTSTRTKQNWNNFDLWGSKHSQAKLPWQHNLSGVLPTAHQLSLAALSNQGSPMLDILVSNRGIFAPFFSPNKRFHVLSHRWPVKTQTCLFSLAVKKTRLFYFQYNTKLLIFLAKKSLVPKTRNYTNTIQDTCWGPSQVLIWTSKGKSLSYGCPTLKWTPWLTSRHWAPENSRPWLT